MGKKSESKIDQYRKLRKRRGRFVSLLVAALLVLAITIGAVSFYGDHVGDFMIMVEKETVMSLSLSETRDFRVKKTTLRPNGVKGQTNTSFYDLPFSKSSKTDFIDVDGTQYYSFESHPGGDSSDRAMNSYFAYTFYLMNTSQEGRTVNYNITVSIGSVYKEVDEAMRFMIIRNRDVKGEANNRWIFAKRNVDDQGVREEGEYVETYSPYQNATYNSIPFVNDFTLGSVNVMGLPAQEIDDYTIVMWLEGDDPDCINKILGGKVMLDMTFSIIS